MKVNKNEIKTVEQPRLQWKRYERIKDSKTNNKRV